MDIAVVDTNNTLKYHGETISGTSPKRCDRRTSIFSQVRTEWKPAADPKENQTHIEYKYDRTTTNRWKSSEKI